MIMLTKVKEEFFFAAYNIDRLISNYLIKRLGVNDIETINALGLKGRLQFENRLDLLMQIKSVSSLDKKKLDVYSKLYKILILKNETLINHDKEYFSFLLENYPQKNDSDPKHKTGYILRDFVLDVQHIIKRISTIPSFNVINEKSKKVEKVVHLSAL